MTQADSLEIAQRDVSPDSGPLRVSSNTSHESGIPPARERLAFRPGSDAALDQLELVLVESTRAEANLGLLVRGLKHLAAGASAAQEANAVLVQELESLRARMSKAYENESLLQQRVVSLENALDASVRDREAWLVQEDAFLAGLLDEHEQKLFDVERGHERRLAELDLAFDELRLQYESAKVDVQRLTYERDAAVALLNEPLESTEPAPSPSAPLASSVRLPTPQPLPSSSHSSSSGLRLGSVKLEKPALKSKPDAVAMPLGGYSMTSDDIEEEPATARPPRL
ncbi:MAG: hypothetical protein EOO73_07475 [Myxococcales bacterium]|nr:MAG: hypothetical protein EOO73_07475 [Myxococcales bacterium]